MINFILNKFKKNYDKYLIKDKYYSEGYKRNSVNVYLIPHNIKVNAQRLNIFRMIWRGDGWIYIGHKVKKDYYITEENAR